MGWNLFTITFISIGLFVSVCLCLCLCLCVTIFGYTESSDLTHFFYSIYLILCKENSKFRHDNSKWEYHCLSGNAPACTLWTIFVHCNTDCLCLCRNQACEVTIDKFSFDFWLAIWNQRKLFLFVRQFSFELVHISLCHHKLFLVQQIVLIGVGRIFG